MAKSGKPKPNRYEGRVKFYVNGVSEDEIGEKELARIIAIGFMRGMMKLSAMGKLDIDLSGWEFRPELLTDNGIQAKN